MPTASLTERLTPGLKVSLIAWIWLVTAFDIWCCQFLDNPMHELNPLARWVMMEYGLWTMVAAKVIGTFLATEIMRHLKLFYTVVIAVGEAALLCILAC